jgi:hypothetical protein
MSEPIKPLYNGVGRVTQSDSVDPLSQYSHLKTGWDLDAADNILLSTNTGNRTFTITPTANEVEYWVAGTRHTLTEAQSVTWDDINGSWFFYFDQNGDFVSSPNVWLFNDTLASVSAIYWDSGLAGIQA